MLYDTVSASSSYVALGADSHRTLPETHGEDGELISDGQGGTDSAAPPSTGASLAHGGDSSSSGAGASAAAGSFSFGTAALRPFPPAPPWRCLLLRRIALSCASPEKAISFLISIALEIEKKSPGIHY